MRRIISSRGGSGSRCKKSIAFERPKEQCEKKRGREREREAQIVIEQRVSVSQSVSQSVPCLCRFSGIARESE